MDGQKEEKEREIDIYSKRRKLFMHPSQPIANAKGGVVTGIAQQFGGPATGS